MSTILDALNKYKKDKEIKTSEGRKDLGHERFLDHGEPREPFPPSGNVGHWEGGAESRRTNILFWVIAGAFLVIIILASSLFFFLLKNIKTQSDTLTAKPRVNQLNVNPPAKEKILIGFKLDEEESKKSQSTATTPASDDKSNPKVVAKTVKPPAETSLPDSPSENQDNSGALLSNQNAKSPNYPKPEVSSSETRDDRTTADSRDRPEASITPIPPAATPVISPVPEPTPNVSNAHRVEAAQLGFKIEGILWDDKSPVVMVDGRMLHQGGKINDYTILKIHKNYIEVTKGGLVQEVTY